VHRRRTYILAALALLLGAGVFLAVHGNKEPRYKGRNLTAWILIYSPLIGESDTRTKQEAQIAINAIGTNALPYLLKWLTYEENKRFAKLRGYLPPILQQTIFGNWLVRPDKVFRSYSAQEAFRALGSNASPAIPELTRLVQSTNSNNDLAANRAIFALRELGDLSIPVLVNSLSLTNLPTSRRVFLSKVLAEKQSFNGDRTACIRPLINCLEDQNPLVAAGAATFLGNLGIEADSVIPALEAAANKHGHQVRVFAIDAIGRFGPKARSATPFLVKALASTIPTEAEAATNALRQVAPEALTNAPAP